MSKALSIINQYDSIMAIKHNKEAVRVVIAEAQDNDKDSLPVAVNPILKVALLQNDNADSNSDSEHEDGEGQKHCHSKKTGSSVVCRSKLWAINTYGCQREVILSVFDETRLYYNRYSLDNTSLHHSYCGNYIVHSELSSDMQYLLLKYYLLGMGKLAESNDSVDLLNKESDNNNRGYSRFGDNKNSCNEDDNEDRDSNNCNTPRPIRKVAYKITRTTVYQVLV